MLGELAQLRPEIQRAEQEFFDSVLRYVLNAQDAAQGDEAALAEMRDSIIRYRSALERLNRCLTTTSQHDLPVPRQAIDRLILRLRERNTALETLLSRARKRLSQ
ncbi:MAG TPA: hypothetical protein VFQ92_08610 [Blastocatellia bacterium]|nr:hypothetical protein [Blastocatellia bacterium]